MNIEPPPVLRYLVQLTAFKVFLDGSKTENMLMGNADFSFLMSSDPHHAFYQHTLAVYRSQNLLEFPKIPDNNTTCEELDAIEPAVWLIAASNPIPPYSLPFFTPGKHISRKELDTIRVTAQFVARYGMDFWLALTKSGKMDSRFEFMNPPDSNFMDFFELAAAYSKVLTHCEKLKNSTACVARVIDCFFTFLQGEKTVAVPLINLNAVIDFFAYMEDKECPLLGHPPMMTPVGFEGMTPKELDTVKVTAQFVAKYGMNFWLAVTKFRNVDSQFEFMKPGGHKSDCFNLLVAAYSKVLTPSEHLKDGTARARSLVDFFFRRLANFDRMQTNQGGRMDYMLHAFGGGLECFTRIYNGDCSISPPPEHISVMTKMLQKLSVGMMHELPLPGTSTPQPRPLTPEPKAKRPRHDKSALVPEDQFLAQHPGSCVIRVSVPNADAGMKVIEITVQSLSENVASLKEKVAGEIQIPANEQKLSGEAGVLMDNMSLAHYNVGAGEILTLSV